MGKCPVCVYYKSSRGKSQVATGYETGGPPGSEAALVGHPERRRDAVHLGGVEHGVRHKVSGSLIDRLSRTPHPPQAVPLPPLGKAQLTVETPVPTRRENTVLPYGCESSRFYTHHYKREEQAPPLPSTLCLRTSLRMTH